MQLTTTPESQSVEYLCDYVYIDHVRLAHYYGQLSEHGLVTQSKRASKATMHDGGEVEVKAVLASGSYRGDKTSENAVELQIDSAFSRPQETLDALYEAGFIKQGLVDARMGQLILEEGEISLFDIRLLKEIWPVFGGVISKQETQHIQNVKDRQKAAAAARKDYDELANVIAKLPHSLQGNLRVANSVAWFTLNPDCMLLNPDDITFKHGSDLAGKWHVLGIVDALPDSQTIFHSAPSDTSQLEDGMRQILAGLRTFLGRPPERYGLTPIMIFRTIKKI